MQADDAHSPEQANDSARLPLPSFESYQDRNLAVFLLDRSGSMGPGRAGTSGTTMPIDVLFEAVSRYFRTDLKEVEMMATNGEVAVGMYGNSKVEWLKLTPDMGTHPFHVARNCGEVPIDPFFASGDTPTVTALRAALDALEVRKTQIRSEGLQIEYRPHIFILTDGGTSESIMEGARLRDEAEKAKKCHVFGLCTSSNPSDQAQLVTLTGENGAYLLEGAASLYAFFQIASTSMNLSAQEATPEEHKAEVAEAVAQDPELKGVSLLDFRRAE